MRGAVQDQRQVLAEGSKDREIETRASKQAYMRSDVRLVMLLLSGMTENELKLTKTSCVEEVLGFGPSLETSAVTLVWDDGKQVKAHKDKLCRGSADKERELIVKSSKHMQPNKLANYNMGKILNQIIIEKKNVDQPCGSLMSRYEIFRI